MRKHDILFGGKKLEHLYTLKNFPVFIGCTDEKYGNDLFSDMIWDINVDSGVIQLQNPLALDVIYSGYHSEAIGRTWENHHKKFAKLVEKFSGKNVLEIGGSNGKLANDIISRKPDVNWTMIEPNPSIKSKGRIKIIKKSFGKKTNFLNKFDTVVHSHVLEHFYNPSENFKKIYDCLEDTGTHIFTVPNLYYWLKNDQPNALNFEHTIFLTEYYIDYLLKINGFKIIKKTHFGKHSIFYVTKKALIPKSGSIKIVNKYNFYKKIYLDFIERNTVLVSRFNDEIKKFNGPVYLFGAHIFSQFLLNLGLNVNKIDAILDNSQLKQEKRLYGTKLFVQSPSLLSGLKRGLVILRAGLYNTEIKKQIKKINPKIKVIT